MIAVDSSVAVPLVAQTHHLHSVVSDWWAGREVALAGHALAETYSVLTRLPGNLRLTPPDAVELIDERFAEPFLLAAKTERRLHVVLAGREIRGGAVYDALVGLAAAEHDVALATRDARARRTYEAVGARVEFVANA